MLIGHFFVNIVMVVAMQGTHEVILAVKSAQTNGTHFEVCQCFVMVRNNMRYIGLNDCSCLIFDLLSDLPIDNSLRYCLAVPQ